MSGIARCHITQLVLQAVPGMGPSVDVSSCSPGLSAGSSCDVICAPGYVGVGASYVCAEDNTNPSQLPNGRAPNCVALSACAPSLELGATFNVTECSDLVPGQSCPVTCATGYVGGQALYSCPSENTDLTQLPQGSPPTCEPILPCAALVSSPSKAWRQSSLYRIDCVVGVLMAADLTADAQRRL